MWGAWAIEPFVGNYLAAIKLEDVVWFGSDGWCSDSLIGARTMPSAPTGIGLRPPSPQERT